MGPSDQLILLVVLWLFFAAAVGLLDRNRGGSFVASFILSLICSPLIAFVVVLVSRKNEEVLERRELRAGRAKKCPQCAELIKPEARICRFCGFNFDSPPKAPPAPVQPPPQEREPIERVTQYRAQSTRQAEALGDSTAKDHGARPAPHAELADDLANETDNDFFSALGLDNGNQLASAHGSTENAAIEHPQKIAVTCSCGAKLLAKRRLAGKSITCPMCQQRIQVPPLT